MLDPLNRRRFLHCTASAAIALDLSSSLGLAGEVELAKLMSHVDPLVRPRKSTLSDSQNALPLLESASKGLTDQPDGEFEIDDCFNPDKPDQERDRLIAAWLDDNQRAIGFVEQAVRRGKLEFPSTPWADNRLDSRFRQLSYFLRLSAQRLTSQGRLAEAAQISRTMSDAFRLLKAGGGVYVEYLIASVCEADSWMVMRQIAQNSKTDRTVVRTILAHLPTRENSVDGLRNAIRAEYCHYMFPLLVKADGADLAKTFQKLIDWNENLELFLARSEYELRCKKLVQLFEGHARPYDLVDTLKRTSAHYADFIRDVDRPWSQHKMQPERNASEELAAWPKQLSLSVFGE